MRDKTEAQNDGGSKHAAKGLETQTSVVTLTTLNADDWSYSICIRQGII